MRIFDNRSVIKLILENKNQYVRLAALDLARDISHVSAVGSMPEICESGNGIIIAENTRDDIDPIDDESFSIVCDGEAVKISAPTYLGTLWGIYTFSERILGIAPTFLWDGIAPQKHEKIDVKPFEIKDAPRGFGFRGIFINDEDLLTGWKISGGRREINYPYYNDTVDVSVMDRVVETALRLRLNLVIPASFLNLANPPEKALADAVAKRGIYLSQHHIEPLGVSTFTFEKYLEKYKKTGEFSYIRNPALMEEIWRHYTSLWSQYDKVIWQIGLRGKIDRPVWEEENPSRDELQRYAEFISNAVARQKEIVLEATGGSAKHFTCTLWMEGARLAKQGFLTHPEGVISVFADNGPNQMYANDFYEVEREDSRAYGIYYHLQYFGLGPHLAPLTGLDKLYYNLKLAYDKGDRAYIILNSSNIREFTFELGAYSRMTWDMESFSKEAYLEEYAARFGEEEKVKRAISDYFDAVAVLDTSLLDKHHGNYFDFRYEDVEGIKNLPVKDGMVVNICRYIIDCFKKDCFAPLWDEYYRAVNNHTPKFDAVRAQFERIAEALPEQVSGGILMHWAVYANTMSGLYGAMCRLYEAKKDRDREEMAQCVASLRKAADEVKNILEYRKCAGSNDFENWYRGDTKLDIPRLLREIENLIGFVQ
jgi:hypothetical protein